MVRWKQQIFKDEDLNLSFFDIQGNRIYLGDIIQYTRKKASGRNYNKTFLKAGTVIEAEVVGIFNQQKIDKNGLVWYLKSMSIIQKKPIKKRYSYRIYNTDNVLNLSSKSTAILGDEFRPNQKTNFPLKDTSDAFSIGL